MTDEPRSPGKTTIAPGVLLTIARLTALNEDGVCRLSPVAGGVNKFFKRNVSDGVCINVKDGIVDVDMYVVLKNNVNVREVSRNIQNKVGRAISDMVGMEVGQINIHIEDINYPEEPC